MYFYQNDIFANQGATILPAIKFKCLKIFVLLYQLQTISFLIYLSGIEKLVRLMEVKERGQ